MNGLSFDCNNDSLLSNLITKPEHLTRVNNLIWNDDGVWEYASCLNNESALSFTMKWLCIVERTIWIGRTTHTMSDMIRMSLSAEQANSNK